MSQDVKKTGLHNAFFNANVELCLMEKANEDLCTGSSYEKVKEFFSNPLPIESLSTILDKPRGVLHILDPILRWKDEWLKEKKASQEQSDLVNDIIGEFILGFSCGVVTDLANM